MIKRNRIIIAIAVFALSAVVVTYRQAAQAGDSMAPVSVTLGLEQRVFHLGEEVALRVEVSNRSSEELKVAKPSFATGSLRLLISSNGRDFRKYVGPNWGNYDELKGDPWVFAAGESVQADAVALYNSVPRFGHLTPLYADRLTQDRVTSVVALPTVGIYWMKAVYATGLGDVESDVVEITVTGAAAGDEALWNRVVDDRPVAYFLATGNVPFPPATSERAAFIENLQSLTTDNPRSPIAQRLAVKLDKWIADQAYIEQIKAEAAKE